MNRVDLLFVRVELNYVTTVTNLGSDTDYHAEFALWCFVTIENRMAFHVTAEADNRESEID